MALLMEPFRSHRRFVVALKSEKGHERHFQNPSIHRGTKDLPPETQATLSDTVDLVRKFKLLFVGLPLSALLLLEKSSSHRLWDAVAVRQWTESRRLASEARLRTFYGPEALSLPKDGKRHYP